MSNEWAFDHKDEFVEKLQELIEVGTPLESIETITPVPVHEAEHLLEHTPSRIRFYTLLGALTGMVTGFSFCVLTVVVLPVITGWSLITGGKPLISTPAFIVITFEFTILFGGIASFIGFLVESRMPTKEVAVPEVLEEPGNRYVIMLREEVGDA